MNSTILAKADLVYESYKDKLGLAVAFLLPLKLSLVYIILIPTLCLWFLKNRLFISGTGALSTTNGKIPTAGIPLLFFIIIAVCSSLFGINTLASIGRLLGFAFFSCALFYYYDITRRETYLHYLAALLAGQALAALHTVFEAAFPESLSRLFLGTVTESGQIALTLVLGFGLLIHLTQEILLARQSSTPNTKAFAFTNLPAQDVCWFLLNIAIFCAIGFSLYLHLSANTVALLSVAAGATILISLYRAYLHLNRSTATQALQTLLLSTFLPLIILALLINLKRGPWAGVICGSMILLAIYSKRLLIPLFAIVVCLFIFIEPLRLRLEQSSRDFFITGGRNVIWEIGGELATRYPLGIGFDNSQFLQKFSPEIPATLKHFHSNVLNILVETGWLGLGAYLWFILSLLMIAFRNNLPPPYSILTTTIGCALIAWQVAGVVEYNFGDSEVYLVALLLCGVMLKLAEGDEFRA
ncbi:O-antigen ligase family protein [Oligoflexia bacterium]|nr:O-antigen ligase family protein [Oligoflexia bacterium]